jgi:hypothetical protein
MAKRNECGGCKRRDTDYANLLRAHVALLDDQANPERHAAQLKAHIAFMNEEAKRLHENYVWVCDRLAQLEKKN